MANNLIKDSNGYWRLPVEPLEITKSSETIIDLATKDTFVDGNIVIKMQPVAAGNLNLQLNSNTGTVNMGTATAGYYNPEVSFSGTAAVESEGWISNDSKNVTSTTKIGKIKAQTIQKDETSISAATTTINPTNSSQTVIISDGYQANSKTFIIGAADSGPKGEVTSGSATINTINYLYDSSAENFVVSGSADISAPTINTAGYISSTKGVKNSNPGGAVVNTTVNKIVLNSGLTGATSARKPTISKQAITTTGVTDAASGSATATAPSSGVYVAVRSNENKDTIRSAPTVKTAGYGDTTNFSVGTAATATVGAAQSDIYYVPITTTTATVSGRTVTYGSGWITGGSSQVALGKVTSGAGTATISTPTWDSTNSKFSQTASGSIAAPTVNTAGYLSSSEGTKVGNNISGSKDLNTVKVGVDVSGTTKVTPAITRTAKPSTDKWTDAASGAATTTKPTSGAYVQVNAAAKSNNLTITGKVSAEGYGTTEHYTADTATTTAVGSNAAANTYVPIKVGTVTSGTASITTTTIAYNSTNSNFDITGSANISAPTVGTEGYVSSSIGTKSENTGGATLTSTLPKIAIQANLSGTGTKVPSITKNSNTNIAQAGNATTTKPSSGYYVAVSSAANTGTVKATAEVSTAGYGTATSGQYTTTPSSNLTVGAAASAVTYIPIISTIFANSATSGVTYTDISSSAPVLVSGDYLYINAGYTPNVKISLAKLVPDADATNAPAKYILDGYTAFDNNGALIVGTMQTFDGTYTIT